MRGYLGVFLCLQWRIGKEREVTERIWSVSGAFGGGFIRVYCVLIER